MTTETPTPADWLPGQYAVWAYVQRGGYGYGYPVEVTIVRVTARRVIVRAPLARGGSRDVAVKPESLRP